MIGEAVSAMAVRRGRGDHMPAIVVQIDGEAGQARFAAVPDAAAIVVVKHRTGDRHFEKEDVALQVRDVGVVLDDLSQPGRLPDQPHFLSGELLVEVKEAGSAWNNNYP